MSFLQSTVDLMYQSIAKESYRYLRGAKAEFPVSGDKDRGNEDFIPFKQSRTGGSQNTRETLHLKSLSR